MLLSSPVSHYFFLTVLPVVWFYLHPFCEEFLVEQFAVGQLPITLA